MNAQKFTQKSLEAIQAAQDITIEHQNMQLEEEHLFYALLTQDQGLIPQLLLKMGVPAERLEADARRAVEALFYAGEIPAVCSKALKRRKVKSFLKMNFHSPAHVLTRTARGGDRQIISMPI